MRALSAREIREELAARGARAPAGATERAEFVEALLASIAAPPAVSAAPVAPPQRRRPSPLNLNECGATTGQPLLCAAVEMYACEALGVEDLATRGPREDGHGARRVGGPAFRVLELLLRAGCDPHFYQVSPRTGDTIAVPGLLASMGLLEGLRLFVAHGRGLDVMVPSHERRKSGLWPLQMAIDQHHTQCALLLLEHASYDAARDPRPLLAAAEVGEVAVLQRLLAMPGTAAVLEQPHPDPSLGGRTALMTACYSGPACVFPLLEAGSNVLAIAGGEVEAGDDADDPRFMRTAMANAIAGGAEPFLIDQLVGRGARRPTLLKRQHAYGTHVYVSPSGEHIEVFDVRHAMSGRSAAKGGGILDGISVIDMRASASPSERAGGVGAAGAGGVSDRRFARLVCSFPECGKAPAFGTVLQVCGRCKMASYCNVDCQRGHWRRHKPDCKAIATA